MCVGVYYCACEAVLLCLHEWTKVKLCNVSDSSVERAVVSFLHNLLENKTTYGRRSLQSVKLLVRSNLKVHLPSECLRLL